MSQEFQGCIKSVSRVFQEWFKSVSTVFHECFMNVSKLFVCMQVIAATRAYGGLNVEYLQNICTFHKSFMMFAGMEIIRD